MRLPTQKNLNANVSSKVLDVFETQREKRGWNKYRAVEGALRVWTGLPPEIQIKIMESSPEKMYDVLVDGLLTAEIEKHLDKLGPTKKKFLALLKQAKEKPSP